MAFAFEPSEPDSLLGLQEVAAAAGITRGTARAWCESGRLPSVAGPGNEPLVRPADLHAWLARRRPAEQPGKGAHDALAGANALRKLASEVSGRLDLQTIFADVVEDAIGLFALSRIGMWLYDSGHSHPYTLAAHHGLHEEILDWVASLEADASAAGTTAIRERDVVTLRDVVVDANGDVRDRYIRNGIRSVCLAPIIFRDEPLGLLVLYHDEIHEWTAEETALARGFADQMATAIGNDRLHESVRSLAARLEAVQDLAVRLNRTHGLTEIADLLIEGAEALIAHDSIRIYRVDHDTGWCEPIAFKGHLLGSPEPSVDLLRVEIGQGLTGWAAAHNATIRLGDASADQRSLPRFRTQSIESIVAVPISFEDHVHAVIVVSASGRDRFSPDDEGTLTIFAGYAAQAIVNANQLDQLDRQRGELEHQLASQRRLLEINERLISTRDPKGVLELIADSLKAIVPYDALTIYRCDFEEGVRRAVVARDRFAEVILDYAGPIEVGISGWVIAHGEGVLANDALDDPRSVQIPGTPSEPEAMIVVPVRVAGDVVGTLNVARMGGEEAYFSQNEFELVQLFAGQASLALENAEVHGAISLRAEHDALTGLRNHGAFQRELGEAVAAAEGAEGQPFAVLMLDLDSFKGFNDACGHPAGDALLARIAEAIREATRSGDGLYRYGGDEFAVILPAANRVDAFEVVERIRRGVAAAPSPTGPRVTISAGVACYPDDGATKDDLVEAADQSLYLSKPTARVDDPEAARRDPYLSALDETAIALMNRHDPEDLLETIITRAAALLGTAHGFIYLLEPDGQTLVVRHGIGIFTDFLNYRMPVDSGLSGMVWREGRAVAVDDYDAWLNRAGDMPTRVFGAVVGVPLTSGGRVVGVIGLASGSYERTFGPRETGALGRFAQLASIALDNAHLFEKAQRGALYDPVTGLPNRDLLTDRVSHSLAWTRDDADPIALILLDLDRFKVINESLGHAVGDSLLVAVGARLQRCLRPADTVARFGGDEFGIILDGVGGVDDARRTADRILAELSEPFTLGSRDWYVNASLGIAMAWPGRATPGDAFREAEVALVRAKSSPGPRYVLFQPEMSAATLERVELENDLRQAIDRDELVLHYQPIVDLATDRIVGVEALVRWQHPTRGLIPPLSFIPVAEETGLIVPIGRWVLETACRQARRWADELPDRPLVMSVNLSPRQFAQPSLVEEVRATLEATGLPADRLELEITESVLLDEGDASAVALRALRDLGVGLVLDDFGTGYSSLSYLRRLPLDTIKIDRSFIDGIDDDDSNLPIVQAVIALAHGLGIEVVAEGIETKPQLDLLRNLVCDRGQGYYFARPQAPATLRALLAGGVAPLA